MSLGEIERHIGNKMGEFKTTCPFCSSGRKKKHERCLSVYRKGTELKWFCHNCNEKGNNKDGSEKFSGGKGNRQRDSHAARDKRIARAY